MFDLDLPFAWQSSRNSLAKMIPLKGLPMSNLMLNASRVQLVLMVMAPLLGAGGGLVAQTPPKSKITRWINVNISLCKRQDKSYVKLRLIAVGQSY